MSLDGQSPAGWRKVTADDVKAPYKSSVVSGPFGSNIGKRFFVDAGVPLIRGNNLTLGGKKFIDDGFVFTGVGFGLVQNLPGVCDVSQYPL